MNTKKRIAFMFIMSGLMASAVVREAAAKTITTPFGPVDDSCVHETPNGGRIDVQSGDVTVQGAVVGHVDACAVSWQLQLPPHRAGDRLTPPASGGWYAWSDTQEATISGTKYPFDDFFEFWNVPTNPSPPSGDTSLQYYWTGLQNNQGLSSNGTGCGSNIMLIQPVLQWGSNGSFGGENWTIASWEVWGCNSSCGSCSVGHSTPETNVSAGDTIEGEMYQTASNLDEWHVSISDTTSGAYTNNNLYNIPNAWPKFGSGQGGVLEMFNVNSSCTDLSTDDSISFSLGGAYAAYPSWNSFYEVDCYGSNNLLSWNAYVISSPSPSCSWNGSVTCSDTTLTWVE